MKKKIIPFLLSAIALSSCSLLGGGGSSSSSSSTNDPNANHYLLEKATYKNEKNAIGNDQAIIYDEEVVMSNESYTTGLRLITWTHKYDAELVMDVEGMDMTRICFYLGLRDKSRYVTEAPDGKSTPAIYADGTMIFEHQIAFEDRPAFFNIEIPSNTKKLKFFMLASWDMSVTFAEITFWDNEGAKERTYPKQTGSHDLVKEIPAFYSRPGDWELIYDGSDEDKKITIENETYTTGIKMLEGGPYSDPAYCFFNIHTSFDYFNFSFAIVDDTHYANEYVPILVSIALDGKKIYEENCFDSDTLKSVSLDVKGGSILYVSADCGEADDKTHDTLHASDIGFINMTLSDTAVFETA